MLTSVSPSVVPRTPRLLRALTLLAFALMLGGGPSGPAWADSVQYAYDAAGRLSAAIDPVNGSAVYQYDAVGNLLSVQQNAATVLVAAQATPASGAPGTVVTIAGTALGTLSTTMVSFNGVPATPTAVSATQVTVTVPAGATTGPVSVTTANGTASTAAAFTVPTQVPPTLAGFSPTLVDQGAAIAVSGTGFDPVLVNNKVFINNLAAVVTAASATSLTVVAPAVTSGHVTVETPNGSATSSTILAIPPLPFTAAQVASVVPSTLGGSVNLSVGAAPQVALATFDATAGQGVALQVTASNLYATLALYDPDGVQLTNMYAANGSFSGGITLAQTGTYTVSALAADTVGGTATVSLLNVSPVTGTISANGEPVVLTTATPGQNVQLTFAASAGQQISLLVQQGSGAWCITAIQQLAGGTSISSNICNYGSEFTGVLVIPVAGTYTIIVSPGSTNVGSVTFTLYTVPPDATNAISIGGAAVALTTTVPGQNMQLTFAANAGQRFSLAELCSNGLGSGENISIVEPNGTTSLFNGSLYGAGFTDLLVAPVAGTYTIKFVAGGTAVGTATFTLYSVPADASAAITIGGAAVTLTTTAPAQNMQLTFAATAGQQISLLKQGTGGVGACCHTITILEPDGATQLYSGEDTGTLFTDVLVTPVAGTYTILSDPSGAAIGTETFTLYPVLPSATSPITIGGPPVVVTTTAPGQNMALPFVAAAGQSFSLLLQGGSGIGGYCDNLTILLPDGTTPFYNSGSCTYGGGFTDVLIAPIAGTYTVTYNLQSVEVGTATFTLYSMVNASATVTPGGGSVSLTTTSPGQNMVLTFAATAGQRVSLLTQESDSMDYDWSLFTIVQPDGITPIYVNGHNIGTQFTGVLVAPVAGTYTMTLNPPGRVMGTVTFTLYNVPPDLSATVNVGDPSASYDVTVPGQAIQVSFTGVAGGSVTVGASAVSTTPAGQCYAVTVLEPDGVTVLQGSNSCNASFTSGSLSLPMSGTYTVVLTPSGTTTGTYSLGVNTP